MATPTGVYADLSEAQLDADIQSLLAQQAASADVAGTTAPVFAEELAKAGYDPSTYKPYQSPEQIAAKQSFDAQWGGTNNLGNTEFQPAFFNFLTQNLAGKGYTQDQLISAVQSQPWYGKLGSGSNPYNAAWGVMQSLGADTSNFNQATSDQWKQWSESRSPEGQERRRPQDGMLGLGGLGEFILTAASMGMNPYNIGIELGATPTYAAMVGNAALAGSGALLSGQPLEKVLESAGISAAAALTGQAAGKAVGGGGLGALAGGAAGGATGAALSGGDKTQAALLGAGKGAFASLGSSNKLTPEQTANLEQQLSGNQQFAQAFGTNDLPTDQQLQDAINSGQLKSGTISMPLQEGAIKWGDTQQLIPQPDGTYVLTGIDGTEKTGAVVVGPSDVDKEELAKFRAEEEAKKQINLPEGFFTTGSEKSFGSQQGAGTNRFGVLGETLGTNQVLGLPKDTSSKTSSKVSSKDSGVTAGDLVSDGYSPLANVPGPGGARTSGPGGPGPGGPGGEGDGGTGGGGGKGSGMAGRFGFSGIPGGGGPQAYSISGSAPLTFGASQLLANLGQSSDPAGELESTKTGKPRENVWNKASLKNLQDALGV
jgi:hypothetical protein